jgi:capsid protein
MLELPHRWHWDGRPHVDPQKEATAAATRLAAGTTTFAAEFAAQGRDWETEMMAQAAALGLSLDEYRGHLVSSLFGGTSQPQVEDEDAEQTQA